MKYATNLEHRASSSRSKHEGESSLGLCDRLDPTRDNSQRQLPTDHDYAVPTREYQTDQMTQTEYAETQPMMTIHGVGHITALIFVLTLGDKSRFGRSRDVGCYLGLRPKRSQSGERDPQLGITRLATLIFEVC